jgi:hypothetical protein
MMSRPGFLARSIVIPTRVFSGVWYSDPGSNQTVFNFTVGIGAPGGNRFVVVGTFGVADFSGPYPTVSSLSINGVSATALVSQTAQGGLKTQGGLWGALVPSGTGNVTVQVIWGGSGVFTCAIGAWVIYDLISTTPSHTAVTNGAQTVALNISDKGVGIGYAYNMWDSGSAPSFTGGLSQDQNQDVPLQGFGGKGGHAAASNDNMAAQSGRTITVPPGSYYAAILTASFR